MSLQPILPQSDQPAECSMLSAIYRRAFEQSQEGILVTDGNNRIALANPAFLDRVGYRLEEIVGRNPRIFASGNVSVENYAAMWRSLAATGKWAGEIWNKSKQGSILWQWMSVSLLEDENSNQRFYIANFSDIGGGTEESRRLVQLAYHDPLTHLPNRLAFESHLAQALRVAEREGHQMAVMLIDLDNFKNINDTLGHQVGDELLMHVAVRLRESVRGSDLVARLGGDEFVVVLPEIEGMVTAARVAAKLQSALGDSYATSTHVLYATPSIGISLYPMDGTDALTLLRNADTAMYCAKNAGRNNHKFFAAPMNVAANERLMLENALRQAITSISPLGSEFKLCFQPQIDSRSGAVSGLEALLRWHSPSHGEISPQRFIGIAEETGLIQPLGDWVIWEACRQIRELKSQGLQGISVAINISAQQLRHENLLLMIKGAMACYDLEASDLEIEITETTAMQTPEVTLSILDQLAAMGIRLAIDDFGTGYSSLAYLKHLPIERLKLDRSFVEEIEIDPNNAAICNATIALAHSLGLQVVAEGVETLAQREFLNALGCDILQGFYYAPPLALEDALTFIRQHAPAAAPSALSE